MGLLLKSPGGINFLINLKARRKKLTIANILNGLLIVGVLALIFNPTAKAIFIRGLMKIGLFQPQLSRPANDKKGNTLPDISFQDADGRILNLSDQKGKVIFISFWATWCPPCIAEMPSINQLYIQFRANPNMMIISVDGDSDFRKSLPFIKKNDFILPVYKVLGQITESLQSNTIPTTLIIDKSGRIVFRHQGAADYTNKEFIKYLSGLSFAKQ
ncbi:TlpA disulfide reductase family protein [Mucilaginibacter sp. UR6-11]|uniref:TlpA disulfide reductase family protein n=1 Tax=Mucilaginibacter sp. UR6-11 TaxID=1435644 RepID=UPI001E345B9E|nr:TlpA disulfide reductase family protein [Mucilaginibacter sp. UR6-11]MCC8427214.1 TlpA family protein disulfide reductase [Mucilaginibacter sp. UR6-11]